MTLAEIEALDTEVLTPKQVASVLGCSEQGLRIQARDDPYGLGFHVILIGSYVKIPKASFLAFMREASK